MDFETKEFSLIDNGDLPEAVAASCAIPLLFKPVLGKPRL
jgi:predicted acylesterase/phospholipase RssA